VADRADLHADGVGGDEGLVGEVVDGAGVAAGGGVDERGGVVAEQGVSAAGEFEVVGDECSSVVCGQLAVMVLPA
jgi:hypothetical protein